MALMADTAPVPRLRWIVPWLLASLAGCRTDALQTPAGPEAGMSEIASLPVDAGPMNVVGGGGNSGFAACVAGRSVACACADGRSGAQVCNGASFEPCRCGELPALAAIKNGVVGNWKGMVATPWVPPYAVVLRLAADGHYSAHCLQAECIALYWGADDDSPEKTYDVQDLRADGKATGEIAIWFFPGDTNRGEVRSLQLGADGSTLTFEVWKDEYGPLKFDLRRVQ
jgi:hypothetical protein